MRSRSGFKPRKKLFQIVQWIRRRPFAFATAFSIDHLLIFADKGGMGSLADKRITSEAIAAFHAFQKERIGFTRMQMFIDRYRGHAVSHDFPVDRDDVVLPRESFKLG